jgi:hypothetical protein
MLLTSVQRLLGVLLMPLERPASRKGAQRANIRNRLAALRQVWLVRRSLDEHLRVRTEIREVLAKRRAESRRGLKGALDSQIYGVA